MCEIISKWKQKKNHIKGKINFISKETEVKFWKKINVYQRILILSVVLGNRESRETRECRNNDLEGLNE